MWDFGRCGLVDNGWNGWPGCCFGLWLVGGSTAALVGGCGFGDWDGLWSV